ncbi:hypothetical protein AB1Y20_014538 [Prymnesium parvum]|uniref:15-cis-phytoene synthase n=1 Tax=Prymnesium parvum TaxID=97485 RepID=A0AB34IDW5_PRYPA|mmetsp:Transcript_40168/g.99580  ORF Transcript_40168/g.99580 Transcript_40168/m.99580 type:complete len:289 (-) Transcript_40168:81-947(-)
MAFRTAATSLNHCVELVRRQDPERFLCNLHAPQAARHGLFAVHAFNVETAKIRAATSEGNIGRMRFAWWRRALSQAAEGAPPDHPVVQALAHAGAHYGWTWRYLEQLLDARETDLDLVQPESGRHLLTYCERTAGALCLLACECARGSDEARAREQAALNVGAALGIATLLRGLPAHASLGCTYIPVDVANRHNLSQKEALQGRDSVALADAVRELSNNGVTHLLAARSLRDELAPSTRAVLLPASVAELVLHRLHVSNYSPFASNVGRPLGLRLQLALGWHWCRGTF